MFIYQLVFGGLMNNDSLFLGKVHAIFSENHTGAIFVSSLTNFRTMNKNTTSECASSNLRDFL